MSRPKKANISLAEKLQKIKDAGLNIPLPADKKIEYEQDALLTDRIKKMLFLLQTAPVKAIQMTYLILYDIEDDKVRKEIAKYLKKKGCIRIQKSVFMISAEHKLYEQMYKDLYEVQQFYDNTDSIILVPFNTTDARSMKVIGKDIQINTIVNKPNVLFF